MAGGKKPGGSTKSASSKFNNLWNKYVKGGFRELYSLATDPNKCYVAATLLLIAEVLLTCLSLKR